MTHFDKENLPIAIIGAGPVGLAAAAHAINRGLEPLVLEAGERVAANVRDWQHVKLFTPWEYLVDPAVERLLSATGWQAPELSRVPRGAELIEHMLDPLVEQTPVGDYVHVSHRVRAITRLGHDRMKDGEREDAPFVLLVDTPHGTRRFLASTVIDASGTWATPNPLGASGVPANGEQELVHRIRYGIPDIEERERDRFGGKRVLVVGSGHSAIHSVLGLHKLADEMPYTRVFWAIRRDNPAKLWGGGEDDELAERGALGNRVHQAVTEGNLELLLGTSIAELRDGPEGIAVVDVDGRQRAVVDEIIAATGSRPDYGMSRELRVELDPVTEAVRSLGPLIDPNHHSCGSVPPHGARELVHPEEGYYIVGMKSYGRAPTFLLRTGYEQVRSVVALVAGDVEAAERVELVLPETGVCNANIGVTDEAGDEAGSCCGAAPAPSSEEPGDEASSCCATASSSPRKEAPSAPSACCSASEPAAPPARVHTSCC
ncbi:MAG: NAD(P)-binding protein [Persicimonas sp.]